MGIAAIVASLIFVGLQLKQTQEIAIASQYHARAALSVENFNAEMESGDLHYWGTLGQWPAENDQSVEDRGRNVLRAAKYLVIVDNHFYQYEAGFLEEDVWQSQLRALRSQLRSNSRARGAVRSRVSIYRPSFLDLANEILDDIDTADYEQE